MYVWIWRHLPGPLAVRLAQTLALLAGAVALLFFVVFPRVEPLLPYSDVTVNQATTPSPSPP
jgi:hypothetical protein